MYKELTPIIAEAIIEGLKGTCQSLEEECSVWEIDPDEFMSKHSGTLDDQIFNCTRCGWWCEIDEAVTVEGEDWCSDCADQEDE